MNLHQFVSETFDVAAYPTKDKLVGAVQLQALQLINSGQKVSIEEIPAAVDQVWAERTNPVGQSAMNTMEAGSFLAKPSAPYVAPDEVDDDVIIRKLLVLFEKGLTDAEATSEILNEYELTEDDVRELIKLAREKQSAAIFEAQQETDEARKCAGQAVDEKIAAQQEADRHLVEKYQLAGAKLPAVEQKKAAELIRDHEEEHIEKEETFDDVKRAFPESPIFTGLLTDMSRGVYPSLPLEFKQWGMIVRWGLLRSGLDVLEHNEHLQPRFYAALVSDPNRGKTACINESRTAIDAIVKQASSEVSQSNNTNPNARTFAKSEDLQSADSGQFLVEEFFDLAKESKKQFEASICTQNAAKICLDPDELSDVFRKAQSSGTKVSTIFTELLKLHSGNRTGNGTKQGGKQQVDNAHLAVLGGATAEGYPALWTGTGGGGDGLMSRFIVITTNAGMVPADPLPSNLAAVADAHKKLVGIIKLPGQTVRLSENARSLLTTWWDSVDKSKKTAIRILETVKQLIIVLGVTNYDHDQPQTEEQKKYFECYGRNLITVGPDIVRQAASFGDYEIAIRECLNPGDSWTQVQAMEQAIIRWAQKNTARKNPKTKREFRRGVHPERMPGGLGAFILAWNNCVNTEVLKNRGKLFKDYGYSL